MKNKRISLEEYIEFLVSNKSIDIPYRFLSQIITIHGYKLPKSALKKTAIEVISGLDLRSPFRSTLRNGSRIPLSATEVPLKNVIADLEALEWQECCVTSIETLKAETETSLSSSGIIHAPELLMESKWKRKFSGEENEVMLLSGIHDKEDNETVKTTEMVKKVTKKKKKMGTVAESGGRKL